MSAAICVALRARQNRFRYTDDVAILNSKALRLGRGNHALANSPGQIIAGFKDGGYDPTRGNANMPHEKTSVNRPIYIRSPRW
jgi:hypothetical protein